MAFADPKANTLLRGPLRLPPTPHELRSRRWTDPIGGLDSATAPSDDVLSLRPPKPSRRPRQGRIAPVPWRRRPKPWSRSRIPLISRLSSIIEDMERPWRAAAFFSARWVRSARVMVRRGMVSHAPSVTFEPTGKGSESSNIMLLFSVPNDEPGHQSRHLCGVQACRRG